jgi:hypothetical protein
MDLGVRKTHPLQLHLIFFSQLISFQDEEMSEMRSRIVTYEKDEQQSWLKHNKRRQISALHRLAQVMRITAENYSDMEALIDLIRRAEDRLDDGEVAEQYQDFDDTLSTLLSRVQTSRRWALNYAERIKILIDLAFHIATQDISEVNHEDSTSMNTIAVVTLVFLPGALVCVSFVVPCPVGLGLFFAVPNNISPSRYAGHILNRFLRNLIRRHGCRYSPVLAANLVLLRHHDSPHGGCPCVVVDVEASHSQETTVG